MTDQGRVRLEVDPLLLGSGKQRRGSLRPGVEVWGVTVTKPLLLEKGSKRRERMNGGVLVSFRRKCKEKESNT